MSDDVRRKNDAPKIIFHQKFLQHPGNLAELTKEICNEIESEIFDGSYGYPKYCAG